MDLPGFEKDLQVPVSDWSFMHGFSPNTQYSPSASHVCGTGKLQKEEELSGQFLPPESL